MPISFSDWYRSLNWDSIRAAFDEEERRRAAMTPDQRTAEQQLIDTRQERARRHIKWLDWCVANKVDPNLVNGYPAPKREDHEARCVPRH